MMTRGRVNQKKSLFLEYASSQKLRQIASQPIDFTLEGSLTPERVRQMTAQACGFQLFYATEQVTSEVMEVLWDLAQETQALHKMHWMQSGEVINDIEGFESEKRPVLHTAMRDLFDAPRSEPPAVEAVQRVKQEHEKLKGFLKSIEGRGFTDCVVVAIGGSQLGPESVYRALSYYKNPQKRVHYVANIDPDNPAAIFKSVDLSKTLVVIVSKSGTTLETVANEEYIRKYYEKASLAPEQHLVTVTCPGTPLDDPSRFLECFHMWDYVGGRYSTTSLCGGLPLAWACGYETYLEFLRGCHEMDVCALQPDLKDNLPLLLALLGIWNRNFLKLSDCVCIPYSYALSRFPAHVQQV